MILAPERNRRSSDYAAAPPAGRPRDECPFCPGREARTPPEVASFRDSGESNTAGWRVRVVPNKFPSVDPGVGAHEVIIETPDHDRTLARATTPEIAEVLSMFRDRILAAGRHPSVRSVVITRNQRAAAGATREHPHAQLLALPVTPKRLAEEVAVARRHREATGGCPWCDMLDRELAGEKRVVVVNDTFAAFAPYASRFPYETWLLPRTHRARFENLGASELRKLAELLRVLLRKMTTELRNPAYNLILMTAPFREKASDTYHWRFELIPRLGREAGFEWATGCFVNPVPPEEAVRRLCKAPPD